METTAKQPRQSARRFARPNRRDLLLGVCVFLIGLGMATWLHWPAFQTYGVHKDDLVQAPHWAAYHQTSFRPDDLILLYASFNESPLQNAIYWVGTWFVEIITLSKYLSVFSYGLLALVFFTVGRAMYGTRFGFLLAMFITLMPDQWDYSAGFFSKFWMIPLLLVCVFLLQTGRFKGLIGLLPFAAIAYPMSSVLIGMTASVYWLQEVFARGGRVRELFRCLAIGSVLAVALLLTKYAAPPDSIGTMRPGSELRSMPELRTGGFPSHYIPTPPLSEELFHHVDHPFTLISAMIFFLVLGRRGISWERSWTALFVASVAGYLLADLLFMRLYIPNRYTRYSMAVLLALWNARNWDLMLMRVRWKYGRPAASVAIVVVGTCAFTLTSEDEKGWTDRSKMTPLCAYIREELPEGILVAGSPKRLDDVMLQGKRSALVPYKLAHPWFTTYYDRIREATRATLRAHFARTPEALNVLHDRYGATHFVVDKELFYLARRRRKVFPNPYDREVRAELAGRRSFFLSPPPPGLFIWEDRNYALLELPVSADVAAGIEAGR